MRIIAVLFCGVLAACSQTGGNEVASRTKAKPAAGTESKQATSRSATARCQDAVAQARRGATNAAMLGGALSMVGGLGGFGGRGGAIAAQAVSVGGSVVQAKAEADTQGVIERECLS
ncbi:hypothetical protein [Mesorhizobium marinum]|uniref:Glycine zipper family protein n=1 Tax=Mesorhizobium marinum TaxID=3228790 RepID=A0ABV3QV88_9HYPH